MDFYQQLQEATSVERNTLLASPIVTAALSGKVSRRNYLDFLSRAFHHVKHTVPLLMACGARLPASMEWLRRAVAHYIEEEIGHHEWILNDIAAVGGDADAVRHSTPDIDTEVMVAYAYDTVMRINPLGLFGMVYVLEGTSVSLATNVADSLQRALGQPAKAFSYLTSHGSLDIEHIGYFEKLVNRFEDGEGRRRIIHSARVFFHLYGNVLRSIDLGEAT
jgi:pyrroloquinoline quinone (PQQ) biosynthesis protein C